MSSLFTALLGGNVMANSQGSSTANLLGQNAQVALGQMSTDNANLASQESLYSQLYSQSLASASGLLGAPIQNAGALTGLKRINPTGPAGALATTAGFSLKGN